MAVLSPSVKVSRKASSSDLPEDILQRIIAFLFVDELFTASVASHEFHKIIRERSQVVDTGPLIDITNARIDLLVRLFPSATTVHIPLAEHMSVDSLANALHGWPSLSDLRVHGVKWHARPYKISVISRPLPPLLHIFPPSNCLQVLRITGDIFLSWDDLIGLVKSDHLKVLELKGLRTVNDDGLLQLLKGDETTFRGDRLKRLLLSDCTRLKVFNYPSQNLKDLDLEHDISISTFSSSMPRLLTVNLSFCTSLLDEGVGSLLQRAPKLQHIRLKGCSKLLHLNIISDCLLSLDCSLCSHLSTLVLGGSKLVSVKTDQCVSLSRACFYIPASSYLDLRYLAIQSLTIHIDPMKFSRLNLSGCKSLREEEVSIVAAGKHPKRSDHFVWGCGRPITRPKFEVIICGTPLSAKSFPNLDPARVKGGGKPMPWPAI